MDRKNKSKIKGGYYMMARDTEGSWIANAQPVIRETWNYLIRNANYKTVKYNGFLVERGQLFRTYKEIREALKWSIGFRKATYSEGQMKRAMNALMNEGMITLVKRPRGNLITVLQYAKYQDPKNYEQTNERTKNEPRTDQEQTSGDLSISKEREERKKENISKDIESKDSESYGNQDINKLLEFLKDQLGLTDFKESQKVQRQYGQHLVNLAKKIGKDEFIDRLKGLANNEFHLKNLGSLKYMYKNIKGYVKAKKDTSIPEFGFNINK